jgi:16S rRNA (guanine966-N2)-methyltransferase
MIQLPKVIMMLRIISGLYKGRKFKEADPLLTRPTTDKNKEMIFNVLGQYFEGGTCLDLFAGSGALGMEALSRGIEHAYFVDKNKGPASIIRENLETLHIGLGTEAFVFQEDYLSFLKTHETLRFELVFLDPPYALPVLGEVLTFLATHQMLAGGGVIVAETDKTTILPPKIGGIVIFKEVKEGNSKFAFYRWGEES